MEKEENEKNGNGCFGKIITGIFALAIALFAIGFFFGDDENGTTKKEEITVIEQDATQKTVVKTWEDKSYEEREVWIKQYIQKPDDKGYALVYAMETGVKTKFNIPNSVDFNWGESPTFVKARVVEADMGLVFVEGHGTAKNAFGVESNFSYTIKVIITEPQKYIKSIEVYQ